MSQASEWIINKALGKELNANNLDIVTIGKIDGKDAWKFPDGSKMVQIASNNYIEIEELK